MLWLWKKQLRDVYKRQGLIKAVVENATIPVIETGTGNCHIYIDKDADIEKAVTVSYTHLDVYKRQL